MVTAAAILGAVAVTWGGAWLHGRRFKAPDVTKPERHSANDPSSGIYL